MPKTGEINSPFDDYIPEASHEKNDSAGRSLDKEPGYKPADSSPNAPSVTWRHTNADSGSSPGLSDSQGPDTIKKRVS